VDLRCDPDERRAVFRRSRSVLTVVSVHVDAMATIEHDADTEIDVVFEWRLEALQRAGYPRAQARLLAAAQEIDLREAERLLKQGCPAEIAAKILL
jgi:phage gp29-like protein